jgi:ABC-2 type transport system ATP-binding protein
MESTSRSEDDVILSLEGVNLVFRADVHRSGSWRDLFTRLASDPASAFIGEKDRLHVARDISLHVRRGDRVGILGVNGAGKTSLCRAVAGMYRPASGVIRRTGRLRAVFDTAVGMQPELTGRENAELLARFLYPEEPDRQALVDEALEFSELGRFLDVPYRLYSNGMQARLCLSLVSCRPCDLLILDEVFEGADAFFREKISRRVSALIESSGAVLFVSHSVEQVRRVCNRAILLRDGRVAFDGPVEEALRAYAAR